MSVCASDLPDALVRDVLAEAKLLLANIHPGAMSYRRAWRAIYSAAVDRGLPDDLARDLAGDAAHHIQAIW